ncbi:MAG TPA: thiamine pyrophosphate-binding protein [Thermoanaerobaculia bacterium]
MTMTGGELVLRALEDEGICFAFGIPGTHNIELYDMLATSEIVRPVLVTDEQSASFMADAVWRASGQMACVNVVPGAGLTHALSGIAEAFMDAVPMLVLGCGIRRDSSMGYQLHDVDQAAIVGPVTKETLRPSSGEEIYSTIRRACRVARDGRPGPVFVEIPANLYLFKFADPDRTPPLTRVVDLFGGVDEIERAAELLNAARRTLIYVGLGAANARDDIVLLAEKLEAPVASTFQGKGVFPESHPLALWPGYGAAAPSFARKIAATCDVTLAIGCRFGEVATGSYGAPPPGTLIHIDIDPEALGRNYPPKVAILGDAGAILPELVERVEQRIVDPELRASILAGRVEAFREIEGPAETGVSPGRLLRALQKRLGPETIFTADSGNGTFIAVEALVLDEPGKLLAPVDYSCMGYSVPAAIGAKMVMPDSPVVALVGDGAFLMTGLELLTAASAGVAAAFFVLRDRELAQIAQFQSVAFNRKASSLLPDYDLEAICRGVNVECVHLDSDAGIPAALDEVSTILAKGAPAVVDVAIDYSRKTFFTRGVVRTNLGRLPWKDRLRFVSRALVRKLH